MHNSKHPLGLAISAACDHPEVPSPQPKELTPGPRGAEPTGTGLRGAFPGEKPAEEPPEGSPPSPDPVWEGEPPPLRLPRGRRGRQTIPFQANASHGQTQALPHGSGMPLAQKRVDTTRPACWHFSS